MYTALNISSHNIKILSLKGRQVKAWTSVGLANGLVRDGLIIQPQAVGEAIDALFTSSGISRSNVIICIAGLPFTYHIINLPRLKSALTEEAILRTAKKEISLPLDELYVSWQPIVSKSKDEQQKYFVLGVPRNPVDTLLETLKIANVEPYLMELQPLALARAANRGDAIVVNMEPDCFDIVLIANGSPTVIYTLTPRGESTTLADNVRRLADELTKIVAFTQSNNPEVQLSSSTPLLLTGETVTDLTAGALLQTEVEYPLEPLIPPVEFPDDLPVASYTTSIGTALKKTPPKPTAPSGTLPFIDINVDTLAAKNRATAIKPVAAKSLMLAALVVVAIGILIPLFMVRNQVNTENQSLTADLSRVNQQIDLAKLVHQEALITEASINETIISAAALQAAYKNILSTRGNMNTGLQRITRALPPNAYFTSIEVHKDTTEIRGEADSAFTVTTYAAALEATGAFSEVRIAQMDESAVTVPGNSTNNPAPPPVNIITFDIICTN